MDADRGDNKVEALQVEDSTVDIPGMETGAWEDKMVEMGAYGLAD